MSSLSRVASLRLPRGRRALFCAAAALASACGSVSSGSGADGGPGDQDGAPPTGGLVGTYEVTDLDGDLSLMPRDMRWLGFGADGRYDILTEGSLGVRTANRGLFQAEDGRVFLSIQSGVATLFSYTIDGDTLTLDSGVGKITATASDAMPAATEWVTPIEVDHRIVLGPYSSDLDATDLAWDGSALWYGNGYTDRGQLVRYDFDAEAELSALDVGISAWGLAWDGANLWGSSNGNPSVYKVNMGNGATLVTSAPMGAWIPGIAWDGTHLWAVSNNERTLYEYDPAADDVVGMTELGILQANPGGLEVADGALYMALGDSVQKIDPGEMQVTQAYRLPGMLISGIAYDGTSFYLMGQEGQDVVLVKAALP